MRWELVIDEIETYMRIGIEEHEQRMPQRLLVSARIWADYTAKPASMEEYVDYGMLHSLVVHQWPTRPQTDLLETLAQELFAYIFQQSPTIEEVEVSLCKPDIFDEVKALGIKARLTRKEYEAL